MDTGTPGCRNRRSRTPAWSRSRTWDHANPPRRRTPDHRTRAERRCSVAARRSRFHEPVCPCRPRSASRASPRRCRRLPCSGRTAHGRAAPGFGRLEKASGKRQPAVWRGAWESRSPSAGARRRRTPGQRNGCSWKARRQKHAARSLQISLVPVNAAVTRTRNKRI